MGWALRSIADPPFEISRPHVISGLGHHVANQSLPIVRLPSAVRCSVGDRAGLLSRLMAPVEASEKKIYEAISRDSRFLGQHRSAGQTGAQAIRAERISRDRRQASPRAPQLSLAPIASASSATSDLSAKYRSESPRVRDLVARVVQRYGRNAQEIDRTDGLRGLTLLDRMDLEAIFLYEKYPAEFRRLIGLMNGDSAADLLVDWREYFGLKRADPIDRENLITEISRLSPAQRRVALRYPNVLPLILADPRAMTELIDRMARDEPALADVLAMLCTISLERGPSDLRFALRIIDRHGSLATDAFRRQGLEGFAIVALYGPVLEALGECAALDDSLILLRVNVNTSTSCS